MTLAPFNLKQLLYCPRGMDRVNEGLPRHTLFRLTALRSLVLREVHGPLAALPAEALRQLRELVLQDCHRVESAIFVPGSLASLEQLHVEAVMECPPDSKEGEDDEMVLPSLPSGKHAEELSRAGDVIMGLGKLRQISGGCYLLHCTLQQRLSVWHFKEMSNGDLGIPWKDKKSYVQTWTKA